MRIRDLTEENVLDEGPIWDKVKGFFKGKPKTQATQATAASSPFDSIPPREVKAILGAILNGKALDTNQKFKLQQIYKQL